jgi:hypothetical protein
MKKTIIPTTFALTLGLFGSLLSAQECYNSNTIDIKWVSYKTLAKIGVGGNFSKNSLKILHKDAPSLKEMLTDATVKLSLDNLDAHNSAKNSNIATFFVANLLTKKSSATIVSVDNKQLTVAITLNKKSLNIPMNYRVEGDKIIASGVIDALDFDLVPALRTLNKNVAGHKNKGWNDIAIAFTMPFTTNCK